MEPLHPKPPNLSDIVHFFSGDSCDYWFQEFGSPRPTIFEVFWHNDYDPQEGRALHWCRWAVVESERIGAIRAALERGLITPKNVKDNLHEGFYVALEPTFDFYGTTPTS